jgi:hypothetical protein
MGNYYFLAAALPPLTLGEVPEISFEEISEMLKINLSKKDYEKTVVFRRFVDLYNIRALFLQDEIDPRGNFDEAELDQALLFHEGLPEYVFEFLDRYETVEERLSHFFELLSLFFQEEIPKQKGFLKQYLIFEREWRLVALALRAKKMRRNVAEELQFEDPTDPLVAQILAQRDADHYEPPVEYEDLKELLLTCGNDPWQQHQVLGKYRFDQITEMVDKPLFNIDWILAYMAQLLIVEHWNRLDKNQGKSLLKKFIS